MIKPFDTIIKLIKQNPADFYVYTHGLVLVYGESLATRTRVMTREIRKHEKEERYLLTEYEFKSTGERDTVWRKDEEISYHKINDNIKWRD